MPTPKQRDKAEHLIRLLEGLRRHEPWPPSPKDVANLCRRCFELTEALATDMGTSLSVCFLPTFEAHSTPEALCCQSVKAISDLHSAAGLDADAGEGAQTRAHAAIDSLVEGLSGLAALAKQRAGGKPPGRPKPATPV
ncbi:MAG: hypothetical protein IT437_07405 [Phycisphaerales bacterium]|nr:hypothetical protein [Phycisphaerales bacterium]